MSQHWYQIIFAILVCARLFVDFAKMVGQFDKENSRTAVVIWALVLYVGINVGWLVILYKIGAFSTLWE